MTALGNPETVDWAALLWECYFEMQAAGELPLD